MKFYKIECDGSFLLDIRSISGLANVQGRMLYDSDDDFVKYNTGVGWVTFFSDSNMGAGSGLDADLLDGQQGSYYLDSSNLTGTVPAARLSGTYNISISGNAATATTAKYA